MKKSLLTLALVCAFSGGASAQSSVTLYGRMDLGLSYDTGSVPGSNPTGNRVLRMRSGMGGASKLGFKGTEDLGGGMSASFVLEGGVSADSGNSGTPFWGRQATVGLSGGLGTVLLGRQFVPLYLNQFYFDPFEASYAGTILTLTESYTTRWDNSIVYTTPNVNGFAASGGVSLGEKAGNSKADRQTGGRLFYSSGPAYFAAGYHRQETGTAVPDKSSWNVGGVYNFGVAKLHAFYQGNKQGTLLNSNQWMIGTTVPVGQGAILASYNQTNDKTATNRDARQYALGYTHSLSKRTNVYANVASVQNRNNGDFTTSGGIGKTQYQIGLGHNF